MNRRISARGYFITGTDTGVGKTFMAVALCHALVQRGVEVGGMKPVASGCVRTPEGLRNKDALALQAAANVALPYDDINPYAFEPAIAPHIAAAEAGVTISLEVLDAAFERIARQSEIVIVEGAGGWLTPLDDSHTLAELPKRWDLPVILIVGLRLGCLNHAMLTVRAIESGGSIIAGWVANSIDPVFERAEENFAHLRARLSAPLLGWIPHGAKPQDKLLDLDAISSSRSCQEGCEHPVR